MKRSLLFAIMVVIYFSLVAQQPFISMTREQLNLVLAKANDKINAGMTLTFSGIVVEIAGIVILLKGLKELDEAEFGTGELFSGFGRYTGGLILMAGAMGLMGSGIPIWAIGASKKKKIEFELMKYRTNGSASAFGIGIKIRF